MIAQPVVEALPVKLGCQGIRSYQERFIKLDDRRGQKGRPNASPQPLSPSSLTISTSRALHEGRFSEGPNVR